jgi:probable phosphoglycerate mutase
VEVEVEVEVGHVELWLVRHGETERSRDGLLAGWADVPLTEKGEEQARALRPFLAGTRFDSAVSSDLVRARATARLAFGEVGTDPRLREMSFGELEGRSWAGLEPHYREALETFREVDFPGGETEAEMEVRVLAFVTSLPEGRHLVFTHGGVIRILTRETGFDEFVPTGSVVVLDWTTRQRLLHHHPEGLARFSWERA